MPPRARARRPAAVGGGTLTGHMQFIDREKGHNEAHIAAKEELLSQLYVLTAVVRDVLAKRLAEPAGRLKRLITWNKDTLERAILDNAVRIAAAAWLSFYNDNRVELDDYMATYLVGAKWKSNKTLQRVQKAETIKDELPTEDSLDVRELLYIAFDAIRKPQSDTQMQKTLAFFTLIEKALKRVTMRIKDHNKHNMNTMKNFVNQVMVIAKKQYEGEQRIQHNKDAETARRENSARRADDAQMAALAKEQQKIVDTAAAAKAIKDAEELAVNAAQAVRRTEDIQRMVGQLTDASNMRTDVETKMRDDGKFARNNAFVVGMNAAVVSLAFIRATYAATLTPRQTTTLAQCDATIRSSAEQHLEFLQTIPFRRIVLKNTLQNARTDDARKRQIEAELATFIIATTGGEINLDKIDEEYQSINDYALFIHDTYVPGSENEAIKFFNYASNRADTLKHMMTSTIDYFATPEFVTTVRKMATDRLSLFKDAFTFIIQTANDRLSKYGKSQYDERLRLPLHKTAAYNANLILTGIKDYYKKKKEQNAVVDETAKYEARLEIYKRKAALVAFKFAVGNRERYTIPFEDVKGSYDAFDEESQLFQAQTDIFAAAAAADASADASAAASGERRIARAALTAMNADEINSADVLNAYGALLTVGEPTTAEMRLAMTAAFDIIKGRADCLDGARALRDTMSDIVGYDARFTRAFNTAFPSTAHGGAKRRAPRKAAAPRAKKVSGVGSKTKKVAACRQRR